MSADEDDLADEEEMPDVQWDIRRQGRAWWGEEARARHALAPEKIEMIEGKLFWSERDRLVMLALLLENVGVDQAVRLGNPAVWREAIEQLSKQG
ncbi:MAG TPA: hypothetical protein VNK04_14485 [Gemmataceae bacterium]|nr:hypothetical protein [Gemmataceae bacterium]